MLEEEEMAFHPTRYNARTLERHVGRKAVIMVLPAARCGDAINRPADRLCCRSYTVDDRGKAESTIMATDTKKLW